MRLVVLWLCAATAGCIRPDLTTCGDLACPAGSTCVSDRRCVTPEQLSECVDKPPDASCIVDGLGGRCTDGACTAVSCGNGVTESGEACDDGNQDSGDGCNGTCTSDESCGNGIVDLAAGEGCDCGTADHLSALCAHANSDDLSAECDATCHPRFCGDGIVDTFEQCDGAPPASASCADFGYYRGALDCDACHLAVSGCSGRCGDAVIDAADGEYCDKTLPNGDTCLTFGGDQGHLACGSACAPSFVGCAHLNWFPIGPQSKPILVMWGGGGRVGVIRTDNSTEVIGPGLLAAAPGLYSAIAGTDTSIVAANNTQFARWTTAGWTTEAAPWSSSATPSSMWASDAAGTFVITSAGSLYHRSLGGTWTADAGTWTGKSFANTRSLPLIMGATPQTWDGAAWQPFTDAPALVQNPTIMLATDDGDGGLWVLFGGEVYHKHDGTWDYVRDSTLASTVLRLEPGLHAAWILTDDLGAGSTTTITAVQRWLVPRLLTLSAVALFVTDGRDVPYLTGGEAVLARHAVGEWESVVGVPNRTLPYHRGDDGPLSLGLPGGCGYMATNSEFELSAKGCRSPAFTADGVEYAISDTGVVDGSTSFDLAGLWDLWRGPGATAVAVVGDHVFAHRDTLGGAWTTTSLLGNAIRVSGLGAGEYVITIYPDPPTPSDPTPPPALWRYDGSWHPVAQNIVADDLRVTPTSVLVLDYTTGQIVRFDRSTWAKTLVPALPYRASAFDASSDVDIFAVTSEAPTDQSPLWWFDGSSWTPVRVPISNPDLSDVLVAEHKVVVDNVLEGGQGEYFQAWMLDRTGW